MAAPKCPRRFWALIIPRRNRALRLSLKSAIAVKPDTVIGIIEVMKLMNSVTADVEGIVTAIHAEDGVLVEHGQALISVQPE